MTYLTDKKRVQDPMTRSHAHDLIGEIATRAWNNQTPFIDMLLRDPEVTHKISENTLRKITNPLEYIGQSKEIIEAARL